MHVLTLSVSLIVPVYFLFFVLPLFSSDPVQLAAAVRNQVEYYFSKENLKNDSFLISKMDAQNSVAISTILTVSKQT